jgi:hypothetical protein
VLLLALQSAATYYLTHTRLLMENPWIRDRTGGQLLGRQLTEADRVAVDEAIHWLSGRARPGETIAAAMPHWAFLRTGIQAVMPPFEIDPQRAQELLDSVPVTYLVHESPRFHPWRYVDQVVRTHPDRWELVYTATSGLAHIYKRSGTP